MNPPAAPGLDPAAVLPIAEELPVVARTLAQLLEDAVAQRARLTTELLADWHGASRAAFAAGEVAHAGRAAELVAALRRLSAEVVDAASIARRHQHAAAAAAPAPPPPTGGRRRPPPWAPTPGPAPAPSPWPPAPNGRPSGDADHDGRRDPGWEPGNVRDDVAI